MNTRLREKIQRELSLAPDKRVMGGHGDLATFHLLVTLLIEDDVQAGREDVVYDYILPQPIECLTCRFHSGEFHEKMPCWTCIPEFPQLPKWRSNRGRG